MPKFDCIDLKHIPIYLTTQETEDPLQFIYEFYAHEIDLIYARKELKRWFRAALSEKQTLSKNEMVCLFGFKDFFIRLLEASYLVYNNNCNKILHTIILQEETHSLPDPNYFHDPRYEGDNAWYFFPRYLTRKEVINPVKVFSKIFKSKSLSKWRKTIEDLFSAAISNCNAYAIVEDGGDVLADFDCLFKLLEATHLIYVRLSTKN